MTRGDGARIAQWTAIVALVVTLGGLAVSVGRAAEQLARLGEDVRTVAGKLEGIAIEQAAALADLRARVLVLEEERRRDGSR